MYKTFSAKCILCLVLVLMMALPLAACQPPIDDQVDVNADPTEDVIATVEPTEEVETTEPVEPVETEVDTTESVEPTEETTETAATTAATTTDSSKTEAPKTQSPKTEAPKTEAPKTESPATEKPKTQKMGSFSAEDTNGKSYNFKSVFSKNKITMLNCWYTGCGPCIKEMPEINQIAKDFSSRGVQVFGVLWDSETKWDLAMSIIDSTGATYPQLRNQEGVQKAIFDRFNVKAFPVTFFVDSEGNILKTDTGANTYDSWAKTLNELLAGL